MIDDQYGWLTGNALGSSSWDIENLYRTSDGGTSWQEITVPAGVYRVVKITFIDSRIGKAWAEDFDVEELFFETSDGGITWTNLSTPATRQSRMIEDVIDFHFWTRDIGALIVRDNTISSNSVPNPSFGTLQVFVSLDGGRTWEHRHTFAKKAISTDYETNFTSDGGLIAGPGGEIVAIDGLTGKVKTIESPGSVPITSVQRFDSETIILAQSDGHIRWSTDDGTTWSEDSMLPARRYPAPWFYLAVLLCVLWFIPPAWSASKRFALNEPQESVANILVSDRPLNPEDHDAYDVTSVALGISNFIRNRDTTPPLTMAVTGEWGTGKSSLMNLVRCDLRRFGFRPIWFNAWHHQKEEHLLAALLETIQRESLPPLWLPVGWKFRLRLLWRRSRLRWWRTVFWIAVLSFALGYVGTDYKSRLNDVTTFTQTVAGLFKEDVSTRGDPDEKDAPSNPNPNANGDDETRNARGDPVEKDAPSNSNTNANGDDGTRKESDSSSGGLQQVGTFAAMIGIVTTLLSLLRTFTAFGLSPASLMASMSGSSRLRDLKAQTGFRHKFACEFEDVTSALKPNTMVIMIDDLDRCRPQNMLDILEAVNFLVTSGECIVIMGMAERPVIRCIGEMFKDIIDTGSMDESNRPAESKEISELPDVDNGLDPKVKAARERYANEYLEKMINIRVPVPKANPKQSDALIEASVQDALGKPRRWRSLLYGQVKAWTPVIVVIAIAFGAAYGGVLFSTPTTTDIPESAFELAFQTPAQPGSLPTMNGTSSETPNGETQSNQGLTFGPRTPAVMTSPQQAPDSTMWYPLPYLIVIGLVVWIILRTMKQPPIRDSREFIQALIDWRPVFTNKKSSPRWIKRFLNRVRFYAMRARPIHPDPTRWETLFDRVRSAFRERRLKVLFVSPEQSRAKSISDDMIVAMASLNLFNPGWLKKDEFWTNFGGFLEEHWKDFPEEFMEKNLQNWAERWRDISMHREDFMNILASVDFDKS